MVAPLASERESDSSNSTASWHIFKTLFTLQVSIAQLGRVRTKTQFGFGQVCICLVLVVDLCAGCGFVVEPKGRGPRKVFWCWRKSNALNFLLRATASATSELHCVQISRRPLIIIAIIDIIIGVVIIHISCARPTWFLGLALAQLRPLVGKLFIASDLGERASCSGRANLFVVLLAISRPRPVRLLAPPRPRRLVIDSSSARAHL